MKQIPLNKPYMDDEIKQNVIKVLDSGYYVLGNECKELEKQFAEYIGVKHCVLTQSGTAALFLSFVALGIQKGDEIIVPSHTDFSTIEAIFYVGAIPKFIDIEENSFNMDVHKLSKLLTDKTKAILPVHMYGQPVKMDTLMDFAKEHNLLVIEDCCQAHGAEFNNKKAGSMGDTGCFSFYVAKNMQVCGDGGAITTNNDEVAEKIRMLRNHGRKEKYKHEELGYNLRFNEMNAAIGLVQLKKLSGFVKERQRVANMYREKLKDVSNIILPQEIHGTHAYHLFVIRTPQRDKLQEFLKEKGIQSIIHYPIPTHTQGGTIKVLTRRNLPLPSPLLITEKIAQDILSIPMYPTLTEEDIDYVVASIKEFFTK